MIDAGALLAVSHSGGKDSQAMMIRLRTLLVPPDQLVVVHALLGCVEWPGTLVHIRATIGEAPLILARAKEDLLAMVRRRGFWPTPAIRNCTSDKERGPIKRELRRYLKANPRFGGRIISCMGLRADESRDRARRVPVSVSARNSKAGRRWIDWLPIHDMTEAEVFDTIAAAGERPHWVYAKGMSRCSCTLGHHGHARGPAPGRAVPAAPRRRIHRPRRGDRPHAQRDAGAVARDRRLAGKPPLIHRN